MSAKKSFDVRRKKSKAEEKPTRKKASVSKRTSTLRERRAKAARVQGGLTLLLVFLVLSGSVYLLWRPEVRIHTVKADPLYEQAIEEIARAHMKGSYYYLFPRDSFFLYPERQIEEAVLKAYPGVSHVSVSRMNFTALHVDVSSRKSAFWWCGTPSSAGEEIPTCYDADEEGFVFKQAEYGTTSPLLVYAELDTASTSDTYPLRARVLGTERIPNILRFSKNIESLGTPLHSIAIREDEADIYTEGGTRITYVIGKEGEAAKSAEATLPKLNLLDGSIEYVDLRFLNKVYIKRIEE